MKELEELKPLLKEHELFLEIHYRAESFFIIVCNDSDDDKTDFLTLYDRPVNEMVEFIKENILDISIESKLGKGPFSWPSPEDRIKK